MRSVIYRCLVVVFLIVVAASCGGASESADVAESGSGDEAVIAEPSPEIAAAPAGVAENGEPRDLDDYLGTAANFVRSTRGAGGDSDQVLEEQRLIQQEIQICMQGQGFTYVPEEVGDGLQFFLQADNEGVSPADYAATDGFGISTRFDAIFDGEFDLSEETNPNDDHLATLSEGEADAWQVALRGLPPERNEQGQIIDPETGEVVQGGGRGQANGGCTLEAQTTVRGDVTALGDLRSEFEELAERIESDPRVTEIRRNWSDCMRSEGFDYDDESAARGDIQAEFRPLLRSFFASGNNDADGDAAPQQGGRPGGGNQLQAVAGLQLSPEQDAELEALQERERSIAVASLTCQGDTGAEIESITADYEAEFVEVNRSALEAFGA